MKKWHFTLKNGAFYPRIQSILAFFLGYFLWFYFVRICGRRWREEKCDLWEMIKCENVNVGVCFTTCSRCTLATHCWGRPPTSCRAFLLRTLAMGRHDWITRQNQIERRIRWFRRYIQSCLPIASILRRPALHSVGSRPQTPHPPLPPQRTQRPKNIKNS
jgi:hypothetical protein